MSKLFLVIALLGTALYLEEPLTCAQTVQTAVTATILDPNSVPYYPAQVTACLTPVTTNPIVNGVSVNPNQGANYCVATVNTNPNGSFTMALWPNGGITPAATQWQFTVTSGGAGPPATKGPQTFQVAITIAGSSQSVSANLSAAAPVLLNSSGSSAASTINSGAWYLSRACNGAANCTQIFADTKYITNATSTSTTTVTCPSNNCNFTSADVGKQVWATTQGTTVGVGFLLFTTYVCPVTTIATVNSAQSITLNATCTASGSGNVVLIWGHDDGTALAGLDAAVGCAAVYAPDTGGGFILTSQPFFLTAPSTSLCNQQLSSSVGPPAPSLIGAGWRESSSIFVIHPNFNWAGCAAISGASQNVCIGGTLHTIANVQFWGTGLTAASNASGCAGAANKIMISTSPTLGTLNGVDVAGICPGASGMRGVELQATDANFDLGGVQEVGTVACAVHGGNSLVFQENDCHNLLVSGGVGLVVDAGAQMLDIGSFPIAGATVNGQLQSRGTHFTAGQGGSTAITVGSGGVWLDYGGYVAVDTGTGAATIGAQVNSGAQAQLTNTILNGTSSILNQGLVISNGGNKIGSAVSASSTGVFAGNQVLTGTCRGTATSSSTLGLYGLGQTATTACTSTTINQGQAVQYVPVSGSVLALMVKAGTGCKSGNTCVFTVMKNNAANPSTPVATTLTCSMVGPASSCIDNAHFDIPVIGDTYSVQFTTGATETLANVTATLLAW